MKKTRNTLLAINACLFLPALLFYGNLSAARVEIRNYKLTRNKSTNEANTEKRWKFWGTLNGVPLKIFRM